MSFLDRLPTPEEMYAERSGKPLLKGKSRLEQLAEEKKLTLVDEREFLKIVRERDRMHCRMCRRKVIVQLARDPKRAEVHHIHGRRGVLQFEDRCALLVCQSCHEKLTGKVNEKFIVVGTAFLMIDGRERIDARQPVTFERVA